MTLSILFSKSLKTGEVPQDWKDAIITPLHKKGKRDEPNNYRPISLTSVVCKIMESVIKDKVLEFLLNNNLISNHQHGFIPGKSCQTNLLIMLNMLTKVFDDECNVDIIHLLRY